MTNRRRNFPAFITHHEDRPDVIEHFADKIPYIPAPETVTETAPETVTETAPETVTETAPDVVAPKPEPKKVLIIYPPSGATARPWNTRLDEWLKQGWKIVETDSADSKTTE